MGWTYCNRGKQPIKDFIREQVDCQNDSGSWKCRDIAIVNLRTAYIACEIARPGQAPRVVALVFLLDFRPKEYHDTGYKDMDETMGPYQTDCPKRILDLLTPLPDDTDSYASKWRASCRANLEKKAKFKPGVKFALAQPARFGDGVIRSEFIYEKRGRYRCTKDGVVCRLSKWALDNITFIGGAL